MWIRIVIVFKVSIAQKKPLPLSRKIDTDYIRAVHPPVLQYALTIFTNRPQCSCRPPVICQPPVQYQQFNSNVAWKSHACPSLAQEYENLYKEIKHSCYRPEVHRSFQEIKVPRLRDNGPGGGKVVSLTHRPPLPPRKYSLYSFLLEAGSTPVS